MSNDLGTTDNGQYVTNVVRAVFTSRAIVDVREDSGTVFADWVKISPDSPNPETAQPAVDLMLALRMVERSMPATDGNTPRLQPFQFTDKGLQIPVETLEALKKTNFLDTLHQVSQANHNAKDFLAFAQASLPHPSTVMQVLWNGSPTTVFKFEDPATAKAFADKLNAANINATGGKIINADFQQIDGKEYVMAPMEAMRNLDNQQIIDLAVNLAAGPQKITPSASIAQVDKVPPLAAVQPHNLLPVSASTTVQPKGLEGLSLPHTNHAGKNYRQSRQFFHDNEQALATHFTTHKEDLAALEKLMAEKMKDKHGQHSYRSFFSKDGVLDVAALEHDLKETGFYKGKIDRYVGEGVWNGVDTALKNIAKPTIPS